MDKTRSLTWDYDRPPHLIRLGQEETAITTSIIDGAPCLIMIPILPKDRGRPVADVIGGSVLPESAVVLRFATPQSVEQQISALRQILLDPSASAGDLYREGNT